MHSTPLINTQNLYSVRRDVYVLQDTQFLQPTAEADTSLDLFSPRSVI